VNPIIDVQHLSVSFKAKKSNQMVHAVNDVSFQVREGEIFGLLGPNGAGKSSIIRMICGLLTPKSGNVWINGVNHQNRLQSLQYITSVLEGNRNLYWRMTVDENISYFAGNRGIRFTDVREQVNELLHRFQLEEKRSELVGNLSRGMQQKVAIIVALCLDTKVILLDEPTLGLDVKMTNELKRILRQIRDDFGKTVIISTHDMNLVEEICERVVIIDRGKKIVEEPVEKLMELFAVQSYLLTVEGGEISASTMKRITQTFPGFTYDSRFEAYAVDIPDNPSFFTFVELLKEEGVFIARIEPARMDFERVFTTLCERNPIDVVRA
jgi:ABC-2 type transport system ATP-binding protein